MNIEEMTLEHVENIKDILETEFDDFWNYNILTNEIKNENSIYLVLKNEENEIIGFAGITVILDFAELNNIVIKKSERGKGHSKLLLNTLIQKAEESGCKQINLEVEENNMVAIKLYKSLEFKQVGLRKKYYNGKDALLFTRIIG